MKRLLAVLLAIALLVSGCMDRKDIEDISLALIIGIDLNDEDKLQISTSSPVFSREAKIKTEINIVGADSLRAARDENDRTFTAYTSGGKTQLFLIGKKLMRREGWFKLLDPFLREPKNTSSMCIVLVDGPVSEVMSFNPRDKPRLPIYLTRLVDTASRRNLCIRTTLQELHSIDYEKGKTASLAELRLANKVIIKGSALLNEKGIYKMSIGADETRLLRMLQTEKAGEILFSFKHGNKSGDPAVPDNAYMINIQKYTAKLKTGYSDGRFTFDYRFKIRALLAEKLFSLDPLQEDKVLQAEMNRQLEEKFTRLIGKIQQAKIDPIGLGNYARAYRYSEWKKVQNRWGEALADADIRVRVDVTIASMGAIR